MDISGSDCEAQTLCMALMGSSLIVLFYMRL